MTEITTETPGTSPVPPAEQPPAPQTPSPEPEPQSPQPPNDPPAEPAQPTQPAAALKRESEKAEPPGQEPVEQLSQDDKPGVEVEHQGEQTKTAELIAPKKKVWIFGKPAEQGGEEDEWLQVIQRPLSVLNSMTFFGMMADTIVASLDSGVSELDQLLGRVQSVGAKLDMSMLDDPGQFFLIILRLMRQAPDFIVNAFIMWLEVKPGDEMWFRQIIRQRHNPEEEEWGPTQEMIGEIIEVFLEQNYEETRRFFTETLQKVVAKARLLEEQRKVKAELVRGSDSAPLKR